MHIQDYKSLCAAIMICVFCLTEIEILHFGPCDLKLGQTQGELSVIVHVRCICVANLVTAVQYLAAIMHIQVLCVMI